MCRSPFGGKGRCGGDGEIDKMSGACEEKDERVTRGTEG